MKQKKPAKPVKPVKMIQTKKIAKKIDDISGNHAHKSIKLSDLDKYEKQMYATIQPIFANGTLNDLQKPLLDTYYQIIATYVSDNVGDEQFEVDVPWYDLYIEVLNPFADSFVPDLIALLKENDEPLTKERALSITVTETTRLTAMCATGMMMLYNGLIDEIWG
jgi:hypothetical protein